MMQTCAKFACADTLNKYASLELVFLSYSLTCVFMLYYFFVFCQVSPSLALGHFILGNVFGAQVS